MPISTRSLWPSRNWDSILAAIAGILIIHSFCRHSGIGVSPDSVDYLSTASNICHHGVAANYTGSPLVNFPLGYPILLSAIEWITGKDALACGPVLNEALFGILIFLCGVLMEGFAVRSRLYKWAVLSLILLNPGLLEVYSMLWSETVFLVLLLLFIVFLRRYLVSADATEGLRRLWAPALIAALACVTRYAGITLIATGGILILWQAWLKWRQRIAHVLIFGAVACSLLLINLWHNVVLTGTLTGHRERGIESLGQVLHDYASVFLTWVTIIYKPNLVIWVITALCVGWVVAILARRWRHKQAFPYQLVAIVYFLIYSGFIILTAALSRFQQLDSRLLSPAFLPWLLVASGEAAMLLRSEKSKPRRSYSMWVIVYVGLFVMTQQDQIKVYLENWEGIRDAGIPGYTEDDWTHSPTMAFVKENFASAAPLYSNADDAIWMLTGLQATRLPHKESGSETGSLMGHDRFYVAWFKDGYNSDLINIEKIGQTKLMVWTKQFPDGAVYYFTSR